MTIATWPRFLIFLNVRFIDLNFQEKPFLSYDEAFTMIIHEIN